MALQVSHPPARGLRTSRRALTGRLATAAGTAVTFESSLERDWLILLDSDPCVEAIEVQPFSLYHTVDGRRRRYTPDVLARYGGNETQPKVVVYEVKPIEELREKWAEYRPRFKACLHYCREQGWGFKIVSERHIRTPRLVNARFLRSYRSHPLDALAREQLLHTLQSLGQTTPQALLAAAYGSRDAQLTALPSLWQLVASRLVACDLDAPLTMTSRIWAAEEDD
jgi:hypothetical protein